MDTPTYIIQLTRAGELWYLARQNSPLGVTFDKTPDITIATKFSGIGAGGMLILARKRWPDHEAELVEVELPGTDAPTDRANVPPPPSAAPKADAQPQAKPHRELDPVVTAYLDQFMDLTWRDALVDIAQDRIVALAGKHGTVEQRARLAITTAALEEPIRVAVQTFQRLLRRPSERAVWYKGWLPPSAFARKTAGQVKVWLGVLGCVVKIVDGQDGKGRHVLAFELVGLGEITPQDLWDTQALTQEDGDNISDNNGDNISDDPTAARYRQSARDEDKITPQDADDDLAATRKILDKIAQERCAARNTPAPLDKPDAQP